MFVRLLLESFRRQRRRKLLAGVAILLGATAVTAMLALATTIGDRIHSELAVFGANIVVTPKAANLDVKIGGADIQPATGNAYLHESDLAKLRTIFWTNNITGVSPELSHSLHITIFDTNYNEGRQPPSPDDAHQPQVETQPITMDVPVEGLWFNQKFGSQITGAPVLHPWWKLQGRWPEGPTDVLLGSALAARLHMSRGDMFMYPVSPAPPGQTPRGISMQGLVSGVVTTGGPEDNMVLMPLEHLQYATNLHDAVSRIEISATTLPEDAFARRNPATMSPKDHEIWFCRAYANSIASNIQEALPGSEAQQVRRVEQSAGVVLSRISGLIWLISAAALLAAGFAVSAAMATAVLERRAEIGLMRSLGAARHSIALLFYAETGLLAVLAGTLGYLLGSALAAWLGARIFAAGPAASAPAATMHLATTFNPVLLPVILGLALIVAIGGSTPSIRAALRLDPSTILRSEA
jgi:putative ABC transport system permease protein